MVTETKLETCPFSEEPLLCDKPACDDCEIRIEAAALVNRRVSENLQDYWKNLSCGAD